jgi:hypothetical protein
MSSQSLTTLLRLRVVTDADPGAVARVLERFQNINVLPRRVVVEHGTNGSVYIQVDVSGVSEQMLTLIALKISQVPCVSHVHWHRA